MRFALICPPYPSHVQAFSALARILAARGHSISVAEHDGSGAQIPGERIAIGGGGDASHLHRGAISQSIARTEALCAAAHRFRGADAIIGDQTEPASGLIAAHLGIPLISIACAVPLERGAGIPLPFLGWPYDPSEKGLRRNAGGERVAGWILAKQNRAIRKWAGLLGTPAFAKLEDCISPILTISQTLKGFDYPRTGSRIVETGLLRDATPAPMPFEPARDRPFVYASLGTLQGHRLRLLRVIADGCRDAGVRLMVSHGGKLDDRQAAQIGADWTVDYAPQEAALDRAALCITHGGLNTMMESLQRKVPLIAIPLAFDQFGAAARLEWHGAGLRLSRHFLTRGGIRQAVERILRDPSFGRNAARFAPGPGVGYAADLIEERLTGRRRSA